METILLIESDPAILVAQSLILRCFGYTVLEAGNRGEVWRVCREHQGPIHLLITKAIRDNGSTSGFIARLQLVCPGIRVLLLSDVSSADFAESQSLKYQYAYLQKPFRVDALADTMRKLLDDKEKAASSVT